MLCAWSPPLYDLHAPLCKPELEAVAPKALLGKHGASGLQVDGCSTCTSPEVRHLGVILDSARVKSITKSAFYNLKNVQKIRPITLRLRGRGALSMPSSPTIWMTASCSKQSPG
ncbi:unnamed protein product [Lota lota]